MESAGARSGLWLAAGLAFIGIGATTLFQNVYPSVSPIGWPLLALGFLCIGVAAQMWFGRTSELSPTQANVGAADATPAEEPAPNLAPDSEDLQIVHINYTHQILVGYGTRHDEQYAANVASFRNTLRRNEQVGDAFDVKAELRFAATRDTREFNISGYWLETTDEEVDGIRISVGAAARNLVVALRRTYNDPTVHVVDNQNRDGYRLPPALVTVWQAGMPARNYPFQVLLASEGRILAQVRYVLRIREDAIALVRM
jgi:hypothetical protein